MKKQILQRLIFIVLLAFISLSFVIPAQWYEHIFGENNSIFQKFNAHNITLGLDLVGGSELDYKIDLSDAIAQNEDEDKDNDVDIDAIAESVRDALERRVNPAGVGEIIVQRSQVANEEHVLIQIPPSSNLFQIKRDAEKDNRLEFFAENPHGQKILKDKISIYHSRIDNQNWDAVKNEILKNEKDTSLEIFRLTSIDQISDAKVKAIVKDTDQQLVAKKIVNFTKLPNYSVNKSGGIELKEPAKDIAGILRVTQKETVYEDKITEKTVDARHILIGYKGATRASKDIPYKNKESAQIKAKEILTQLQSGGLTNFTDLAKEFSTEPGVQNTSGELGKQAINTHKFVQPFADAIFSQENIGLISEPVETEFGYHIIDIKNITPKQTTREPVEKAAYEVIAWNPEAFVWDKTDLNGANLENAVVGYNEIGQAQVYLYFTPEGGDIFDRITGKVAADSCENDNSSCRLGIQVGGTWVSQPTVSQRITGQRAQISGNFTFETAKQLADDLNLGAIEAPVSLSGENTIQPQLGRKQLTRNMHAALYGFLATIVFMVFTYRLFGVVASISLLLYVGLYIVLLKLWPASLGGPIVLSLSGFAGIILSIGLAVDGNILIFERIKDEYQRNGKLLLAIDLGFERAWNAIRDSNLTTLLVCIILYNIGGTLIKGFAITLIIGTLLSMFTAVIISRNLIRGLLLVPALQSTKLLPLSSKK